MTSAARARRVSAEESGELPLFLETNSRLAETPVKSNPQSAASEAAGDVLRPETRRCLQNVVMACLGRVPEDGVISRHEIHVRTGVEISVLCFRLDELRHAAPASGGARMKGSRVSTPQAVALFDAGPTTLRCTCGGTVTMGSEPIYGRTLERCDGPCGYVGRPRLDAQTAAAVADEQARAAAAKEPRPCSGGCGKTIKNPRRGRCHVCEREGRGHDLAPRTEAKPVVPIAPEMANDPVIAQMRAEAESERAKYRVCETQGCGNRCSRAQDKVCSRCGNARRKAGDVRRHQKRKGAAA